MLNELVGIIDERAQVAGFEKLASKNLLLASEEHWSEGVLEKQHYYWHSAFASILLVEVNGSTCADAWLEVRHAETFLDAVLLQREKRGTVVDGYLVLAMGKMNDDLKSFVSKVEQNTRFVRKHVVYKIADEWERYQRITPLGLINSSDELQSMEFTPKNTASVELLKSLANLGSKKLAQLHSREWNLNE